MELSKVLFWDIDYTSLDWDENRKFIIGRVISLGKTSDWNSILDYYGKDIIKEVVLQLREIDDKTLNFLSLYFNISKDEFRCYKLKQSLRTHYPF